MNKLSLSNYIVTDFVYRQNPDGTYIIANGDFEKQDRNEIVDTILSCLRQIYTAIINDYKIRPGQPLCNVHLLDQALTRYSRDIFGQSRLKARLDNLKKLGRLTNAEYDNIAQFNDYGMKVNSSAPYIHRQVAVLLYWLTILKPFSIVADTAEIAALGDIFHFHNEYISYVLVLLVLKAYNLTLNINETPLFSDFLYDLHYRSLSRLSLEFFLYKFIETI